MTSVSEQPSPTAGATRTTVAIRRRSRAREIVWALVPPVVFFAAFVGFLYLVSYVILSPGRRFLLPPPHTIVENGLLDGRNLRDQLDALWDTTQVSMAGLGIAFVIGTLLAIMMSQAKWIERSLYPYAVIVQVTPIIAIVPLIAIWFGYDFQARVVVCVLISIFPIITNTLWGLLTVESNLHDLFTLHGTGRLKRLLKLQLPHAVPSIFVGLRISAGLSVIGAIVAEFFFRQGTPGLGRLLDLYRARLQTDLLMSTLLVACGLGIAVFVVVGFIGNRLTKSWFEASNR
ncbi:ABC-type nitrate/sulfonate/bicarbonate transport system permease component [Gaiella occulta]|uniref:ABC-type nitrate/sulfonate/bicarbonate transport system permease component n=1 Tax=Gaiella occulta TaxID=1002870 RepID=A0A7M2Z0I7_9ACTN|nr:ABC transporter permease [Gaiella occulta]RDI75524.1 ABC-type nitrate/sulfonate/bicarbonate transport system permease component [Gaiella occulta]